MVVKPGDIARPYFTDWEDAEGYYAAYVIESVYEYPPYYETWAQGIPIAGSVSQGHEHGGRASEIDGWVLICRPPRIALDVLAPGGEVAGAPGRSLTVPLRVRETNGGPAGDFQVKLGSTVVWSGDLGANGQESFNLDWTPGYVEEVLSLTLHLVTCIDDYPQYITKYNFGQATSFGVPVTPCFPEMAAAFEDPPSGLTPGREVLIQAAAENAGCAGQVRLGVETDSGVRSISEETEIEEEGAVSYEVSVTVPWEETLNVVITPEHRSSSTGWSSGLSVLRDFEIQYPVLTASLDGPDEAPAGAPVTFTATAFNQGEVEGLGQLVLEVGEESTSSKAMEISAGGEVEVQGVFEVPFEESFRVTATPYYLGPGRQMVPGPVQDKQVRVLYPEMVMERFDVPPTARPGSTIRGVAVARNRRGTIGSAYMVVSNGRKTVSEPTVVEAGKQLSVLYTAEMPAEEEVRLQAHAAWLGPDEEEYRSDPLTVAVRPEYALFEYPTHINIYGGPSAMSVHGWMVGRGIELGANTTGERVPPTSNGGPFVFTVPPREVLTIRYSEMGFMYLVANLDIAAVKNNRTVSRRTRLHGIGGLSTLPQFFIGALTQATARRPSVRINQEG